MIIKQGFDGDLFVDSGHEGEEVAGVGGNVILVVGFAEDGEEAGDVFAVEGYVVDGAD